MAHDDRIQGLVLNAQSRVFRLAERDYGLTFKALSLESGIPYNSIRNYAHGETVMSLTALLKLAGVIPDVLLSQLFDPVGKVLVDAEPDDGDHDTVAECCDNVAQLVRRARHPASPAGVEIADCEDRTIRAARAQLRGKAA